MAAIGGMLGLRAIRASRWTDASLLAIGFGVGWTAIIGNRMVSDALDPAVSGNWDLTPWLTGGALVLVAALGGLTWSVLRSEKFSQR
ncbi:MAG TPA: hypothetical protein VJY85_10785 [Candidatus Limnocylindria bacterium]|nr:hypothetical protein [Candidatus Limnocylindria bacterium]